MIQSDLYQPPSKRKVRWDVPPEPESPKFAFGLSSAALSILANLKKAGTVACDSGGERSNSENIKELTNTNTEVTDKEQKTEDMAERIIPESNSNVHNDYQTTLYYPIPTIDLSTNNNCVKPLMDSSNSGLLKRKFVTDAETADSNCNTQIDRKYISEKSGSVNSWESSSEAATVSMEDFEKDELDSEHHQSFDSQDEQPHKRHESSIEQNGGSAIFNRNYNDRTKPWVHIFDTVDEDVKIKLTIYDHFEGADKSDNEDFQKVPFIRIQIAQELSSETVKMIASMRANSMPPSEVNDVIHNVSKYKKRLVPRYKRTPFFLSHSHISMFYDHNNYDGNQKMDLTYRINRRITGIGFFTMTMDVVNYEEEWFIICELFRSLGNNPPPAGKPKIHMITNLSRVILESKEKNDNNKTSIDPFSRIGYFRKFSGTENNISDLLQPRQGLCQVCKFKHNDPESKNQSTKDHHDAHVVENLAPFGLKKGTTTKPPSWYPNDWMPKKVEHLENKVEQNQEKERSDAATVGKNTDVVSTGCKKPKCSVCCEDFVEYYHHDDEVWKLENSVAIDEHIIHVHCSESFNEPLVIQID
ncbi:unnamed protein product [Caenorhabditis brenneri]